MGAAARVPLSNPPRPWNFSLYGGPSLSFVAPADRRWARRSGSASGSGGEGRRGGGASGQAGRLEDVQKVLTGRGFATGFVTGHTGHTGHNGHTGAHRAHGTHTAR